MEAMAKNADTSGTGSSYLLMHQRNGLASHGDASTRSHQKTSVGSLSSITPTTTRTAAAGASEDSPIEATWTARCTCASITLAIFAIWGKWTFVTDGVPGGTTPLHDWKTPVLMNVLYLSSLPMLRWFTAEYLSKSVDVKSLLRESMLLYNIGQVILNAWMVYAFVKAVVFGGHPVIGGGRDTVETGATYAVWVHYCNKYLEYLDTYFMVLRGRMDQVRKHLHQRYRTERVVWEGACVPGVLSHPWCFVLSFVYNMWTKCRFHSFTYTITRRFPLRGGSAWRFILEGTPISVHSSIPSFTC